jgi:hypothetical protein
VALSYGVQQKSDGMYYATLISISPEFPLASLAAITLVALTIVAMLSKKIAYSKPE